MSASLVGSEMCIRDRLSLFGRVGIARLGLEKALAGLGRSGRLRASWFVESADVLAEAVERHRANRSSFLGITPPQTRGV
eukprot:1538690-Alexandrium_andersonii.AAC.1